MEKFRLNFLDENNGYSCAEVVDKAYKFKEEFYKRHPEKKSQRLDVFLQNLSDCRFWGTLSMIDGSNNYINPDSIQKAAESRAWAKETFSNYDLENILNICVNQALLIPLKTGWPGTYIGHSILYRELVDKKESIFAGAVDESFRKRLNNGRFWEELIGMCGGINSGVSYVVINDVLEDNFGDLSVDFAKKGLEIFNREKNVRSFDLHFLTDKSVDLYAKFLGKIYDARESIGLKEEDFSKLFLPYLFESIRVYGMHDENEGMPRFENFKDRLRKDLVVSQIAANNLVRTALAKNLSDYLCFGSNQEHVAEVISCVYEPHEMLARVATQGDSTKTIGNIMKKITLTGKQ